MRSSAFSSNRVNYSRGRAKPRPSCFSAQAATCTLLPKNITVLNAANLRALLGTNHNAQLITRDGEFYNLVLT